MTNLAEHAEHWRARTLQDALTAATANYWERRAEIFLAAAPRPGDFQGQADRREVEARQERCRQVALACRRHALLLREGEEVSLEVLEVLGEAA